MQWKNEYFTVADQSARFFHWYAVKKVEYHADWSKQRELSPMKLKRWTRIKKGFRKLLFYSVSHTTPRASESRYSWKQVSHYSVG